MWLRDEWYGVQTDELPSARADERGRFRSAFRMPEEGSGRQLLLACEQRSWDELSECDRDTTAALTHHGFPALKGEQGHGRITLHLQHFADPATCGPVVVRRGDRKVAEVEPLRQEEDGHWGASLDVPSPGGSWAFSAVQAGGGCDVAARGVLTSYDVWTQPERPLPGEPLLVRGAGFSNACPLLGVSLGGTPLGGVRPDEGGAFALEATAPAAGRHELVVTRDTSEHCAEPLHLVEVVEVGPAGLPSGSPSAAPSDGPSEGASTEPGSTSSSSATPSPGSSGGTPSASPSAVSPRPSMSAVPGARPSLTVGSSTPSPGEPLQVTGAGWWPGEDVLLALDGRRVAELPAGTDGTLSTTVPVPDDAGGRHELTACQRCASASPLLARVALEVPLERRGPFPLAWLALLPVAALPAYRARQRRLLRRVSLAVRRPERVAPRLSPPAGPPGRSVRLDPRRTPPTVRLRETPGEALP